MKANSAIAQGMVLAAVLAAALAESARAVPAFARRYKMSCTTCHAPFPRLKTYGDEFAGAGFVIPEQEKERDYVSAGDDLLWLNRDFPIGVRLDAFAVYAEAGEGDASRDTEADLQTPWGLKLLSGGAIMKGVSYYFYFYMSERGEVAGVEDAYVHFDDLFDAPLDLMVGQFQVCDPLMKRELRLTFEDYEIYRSKPGYSETNLTYDRGIMLAYGLAATGTDLVAMVVNGNGKGAADEDTKLFDADNAKNLAFRLNQAIGGIASVGGFVYYGKEKVRRTAPDGWAEDEILYWGPDLTLAAGPFALTAQYLLRTDSNPGLALVEPDEDTETAGAVAELVISPQGEDGRHHFTLLYNRVDSDLDAHDYETVTGGVTYLLARNLRLTAEYTYDREGERSRIVAGVVTGF